MSRRVTISVVAALAAGLIAYFVYARSVVPPPKVDAIADTWIGFTKDDLNLYRLTLRSDGTGVCAFTFVREPALAYEVTAWKLSGYNVEIVLKPIDPSAEPIRMKGQTAGWHLNLNVSGTGWNRDLKMYRESEVESAYERIHQRMLELEQATPDGA